MTVRDKDGGVVMKEPMYHIELDDNQHSAVIQSLNDSRNARIVEGKPTDMYDELILIIGKAPYRKGRRYERNRDDAR